MDREVKKTQFIKNTAVTAKNTDLRALFRLIFSRIMVTVLLLAGQIYLLVIMLGKVDAEFAKIWLSFFNVSAALCIIVIINSKDNPAFKLVWMPLLCLVPVFGVILYIWITANPIRFAQTKGLSKRIRETEPYLQTEERVKWKLRDEQAAISDIAYYIQHIDGFPTYDWTRVDYFANGEEKFFDLLEELEQARDFIFLEYFIIQKGRVWDEILEVLKKKASEGVEVRLMYDGLNSLSSLPYHYGKRLAPYGIKVREFAPARPFLSSHQNYRDHRKILVIDGRIAYNGGINLADEYMNYKERFGYWKDTAVKVIGDAAKSFTAMFLQMWNIVSPEEEDYDRYLLIGDTADCESDHTDMSPTDGYVIPYNDDPCNKQDVAEAVYLDILNKAKDYVWIMTPYLVPENEMITGLCFAAQRGVDVRIIMPHIPDKKITFDVAHTYYLQLIEAGVKIYEFTPGFVHAKMFLSDDCKAVVGTINLDFRSLYEHFECATLIYMNPVIDRIKEDYLNTFEQCQEFMKEDYKKIPFIHRATGKIFRLFAPLL